MSVRNWRLQHFFNIAGEKLLQVDIRRAAEASQNHVERSQTKSSGAQTMIKAAGESAPQNAVVLPCDT
jgi:hypothetical protein